MAQQTRTSYNIIKQQKMRENDEYFLLAYSVDAALSMRGRIQKMAFN